MQWRRYGFLGFSPYTRPRVLAVAEGIPFAALTGYDVPRLAWQLSDLPENSRVMIQIKND